MPPKMFADFIFQDKQYPIVIRIHIFVVDSMGV